MAVAVYGLLGLRLTTLTPRNVGRWVMVTATRGCTPRAAAIRPCRWPSGPTRGPEGAVHHGVRHHLADRKPGVVRPPEEFRRGDGRVQSRANPSASHVSRPRPQPRVDDAELREEGSGPRSPATASHAPVPPLDLSPCCLSSGGMSDTVSSEDRSGTSRSPGKSRRRDVLGYPVTSGSRRGSAGASSGLMSSSNARSRRSAPTSGAAAVLPSPIDRHSRSTCSASCDIRPASTLEGSAPSGTPSLAIRSAVLCVFAISAVSAANSEPVAIDPDPPSVSVSCFTIAISSPLRRSVRRAFLRSSPCMATTRSEQHGNHEGSSRDTHEDNHKGYRDRRGVVSGRRPVVAGFWARERGRRLRSLTDLTVLLVSPLQPSVLLLDRLSSRLSSLAMRPTGEQRRTMGQVKSRTVRRFTCHPYRGSLFRRTNPGASRPSVAAVLHW